MVHNNLQYLMISANVSGKMLLISCIYKIKIHNK